METNVSTYDADITYNIYFHLSKKKSCGYLYTQSSLYDTHNFWTSMTMMEKDQT